MSIQGRSAASECVFASFLGHIYVYIYERHPDSWLHIFCYMFDTYLCSPTHFTYLTVSTQLFVFAFS